MPGIGVSSSPNLVRLLLAVALTTLIAPNLPEYPGAPTMLVLIPGIIFEILLGLIMGGAVSLVFGGLTFGTEIIGAQTGRAVALQFNPLLEVSQGPIGALAGMMATLVFLGLDLHLAILLTLVDSFYVTPPGEMAVDLFVSMEILTDLMGPTLQSGLELAGRVLTMVFLINCFMAVLARLAPNMNVFFSIGFLLTLIAGSFLTFLSFPHLLDEHTEDVLNVIEVMPALYQRSP